ncbi:MAG: hypothetical protein MJ172_07315 [Clostridia bacterium]|nr:hypothetical protein [Clostridia bacterium]
MKEKKTEELAEVLGKTHIADFEKYINDNKESLDDLKDAFSIYIKDLIASRGFTQQSVFIRADIPERYGYKLLSGEKRTKQRDVILRICYAAELTLDETQRALKKYGMPELYAKAARDAFLMISFNERPGSIIDVNALLQQNGMETLRTSGVQD